MDFVVDTLGEYIYIVTDKLNIFRISDFKKEATNKTKPIKVCTAQEKNISSIQEESA